MQLCLEKDQKQAGRAIIRQKKCVFTRRDEPKKGVACREGKASVCGNDCTTQKQRHSIDSYSGLFYFPKNKVCPEIVWQSPISSKFSANLIIKLS